MNIYLDTQKRSKLSDFFLSISQTHSCLLKEALKATKFTLADRQKCTYLTVNKSGKYIILQVGTVMKNVIISTAVKSRSIVKFYILGWLLAFLTFIIWIFENQVFNVSSICFRYHQIYTNKQTNKHTNKNNHNLQRVSRDFIKSKIKHSRSIYQLIKFLQTFTTSSFFHSKFPQLTPSLKLPKQMSSKLKKKLEKIYD